MDEDWTASHFSPSKARQQRAQALDWEHVNTWLEKRFAPKPVPTFERNEDTLRALLELAAFNENVNEERTLIDNVHEEALKELQDQVKTSKDNGDLLQSVAGALSHDGQVSLDALAESSTALNVSDLNPRTLAEHTVDLSVLEFDVQHQCLRAKAIVTYLEAELDRLHKIKDSLESNDFTGPLDLGKKTVDWTRGTKQLKDKVAEYHDRLRILSDATPDQPVAVATRYMELSLADIQNHLKHLEEDVRVFGGLPHDRDLARLKVAETNQELQNLRRKRDRQFEELVGR